MNTPNSREVEMAEQTVLETLGTQLLPLEEHYQAIEKAIAHLLADYRAMIIGEVKEVVSRKQMDHGRENMEEHQEVLAAIDSLALAGDKKE